MLGLLLTRAVMGQTTPPGQTITVRECVERALTQNRAVQVERLNSRMARAWLSGAYGYYDPAITVQAQDERSADTGGFDPADFSRDAVYSADSEVATGSLTGALPTGLAYQLGGSYAHSSGMRNGFDFDSYKLGVSASARQPLLKNFWIDQGRATILINKRLLKMSELAVAYSVMDLINQVQQAYYELAFSREDLAVRQRLLVSKQRTLAGIRRQVELGALTRPDEILAAAQAARTEAGLISASNAVARAGNVLKTLTGYSTKQWASGELVPSEFLVVVPEKFELLESWERASKQRPDLESFRENVERAKVELRYRHNQLFPAVDLIASYGLRGADAIQTDALDGSRASFNRAADQIGDRDAPNRVVGVIFTTPLAIARERANYRAARLQKEQNTVLLKQQEELIYREVSDAFLNANSALERASATRRAREYADAALRAEEQKLASGKSTLFVVLQLQTDLADTESSEVRARADYNKAVSQLRFAEGSLMEHEGLRLEFK